MMIALALAVVDTLLIRPGAMVDVERGELRRGVAVVVAGDRIVRVDSSAVIRQGPGWRVVDLPNATLLPGLIDTHVHLALAGDPAENLRRTLAAGFTSGGVNVAPRLSLDYLAALRSGDQGEVRRLFRTRTRAEWVALLHEADVCAGPVLDLDEVVRDPQLVQRGLFTTVEHPKLGPMTMQNVIPTLSETPGRVEHPGPELGEHNHAIYVEELGLSEEELARLQAEGAI